MSYAIDQVMHQVAQYVQREQGASSYQVINSIASAFSKDGERGRNVLHQVEMDGIEYTVGVTFKQNGRLRPTSARLTNIDTGVELSLELSDILVQRDDAA